MYMYKLIYIQCLNWRKVEEGLSGCWMNERFIQNKTVTLLRKAKPNKKL